jgi:hypothetical protein
MKGAVTRASDLRFYLPSDAKTGALNADTQLCHQPGLCNYALEFWILKNDLIIAIDVRLFLCAFLLPLWCSGFINRSNYMLPSIKNNASRGY